MLDKHNHRSETSEHLDQLTAKWKRELRGLREVKTDENGVVQWNRTYGGRDCETPTSLLQTTDGGFVLAGYTTSYGAGLSDLWLVKTDAQGIMQWNRPGSVRICSPIGAIPLGHSA